MGTRAAGKGLRLGESVRGEKRIGSLKCSMVGPSSRQPSSNASQASICWADQAAHMGLTDSENPVGAAGLNWQPCVLPSGDVFAAPDSIPLQLSSR